MIQILRVSFLWKNTGNLHCKRFNQHHYSDRLKELLFLKVNVDQN